MIIEKIINKKEFEINIGKVYDKSNFSPTYNVFSEPLFVCSSSVIINEQNIHKVIKSVNKFELDDEIINGSVDELTNEVNKYNKMLELDPYYRLHDKHPLLTGIYYNPNEYNKWFNIKQKGN